LLVFFKAGFSGRLLVINYRKPHFNVRDFLSFQNSTMTVTISRMCLSRLLCSRAERAKAALTIVLLAANVFPENFLCKLPLFQFLVCLVIEDVTVSLRCSKTSMHCTSSKLPTSACFNRSSKWTRSVYAAKLSLSTFVYICVRFVFILLYRKVISAR